MSSAATTCAADVSVAAKRIQTIHKHASDVTKCCFSKRFHLAIGSSDRTVSVWKWRSGRGFEEKSYSPLTHHKYMVTCVQFNEDATILVTSSLDGSTTLCDVETGKIVHTFVQNSCGGIRSSCFVRNYKYFVSAGDNGTMCVWDMFRRVLVRTVTAHEEAISMVCCSIDSRIMLTGDTTGVAKVWSVSELTDTCGKTTPLNILFDCHDMGVNSADISTVTTITNKGKVYSILTCGNDNLVKIWQLTLWKKNAGSHQCAVIMVQSLKGHSSIVTSVCFCGADATLFASTSMDKTTRIWRMVEKNNAVCLQVLEGHTRYVNTCGFSQDGLLFATGSNDKSVIVWDVKGHFDLNVKLHDSSEDLKSTVNVRRDIQVEVSLREKVMFTNAVNSCDFSNECKYLVAAGSDKTIRVWNFDENGRFEECKDSPLYAHHYSVQHMVISPCSLYMASCSLDGMTVIWDLNTLKQKGSLHTEYGGARSCSFSSNSELIAVACDNEIIFVWKIETLQLVAKLSGNDEDVTCVSFSPDSRYLMSGCVEGHFRIWSVHPKKHIISETSTIVYDKAHEIGITCAHFAFKNPSRKPRSILMLTGGNDAMVKTWKLLDDRIDFKMKFVGHGSDITCVKFPRHITTFLASTSLDKTARIWQTKTGDCLHVIDPKDAILTCCSFSSNNKILATGSLDKAMFLWNLPLDDEGATSIRKSTSLEAYGLRLNDDDRRDLEVALSKLSSSTDTPDEFICPITQQIFRDPVICSDGHTYDRSAMMSWFRRGKFSSPLTNEPLVSKSMTPNTTIKEAISVFIQQNRQRK
ncbi:WD repeat, SAM and U-box domain-containing protein 1-like isoform X1 [Melanaphis sacchari]|uniref:WD repeat, SAM and U-box domain-containing protein 1-like isoform X1 n=1 Tax=Melanaphis sacchari TaxID=742174 RepID=UPI000DC150E6|nr:WD repeat, SAM and U-box domain-containing protein 1-like isoform X1 [Melanaphis sacchari]